MNDYYFKAKYIHINQICKQFLKRNNYTWWILFDLTGDTDLLCLKL